MDLHGHSKMIDPEKSSCTTIVVTVANFLSHARVIALDDNNNKEYHESNEQYMEYPCSPSTKHFL